MFIKMALILNKDQKTDDELKAIMATHPWAPALLHGFYKTFGGTWEEYGDRGFYDAIWIDGGIAGFDHNDKWLIENFHAPNLLCRPLSDDPFGPYERRKDKLRKAWWDANVALICHQIPRDYQTYAVYYGEIEDDFETTAAVAAPCANGAEKSGANLTPRPSSFHALSTMPRAAFTLGE
jgi:hypothetical protein